jgi:hypothetical protein
MAGVGGRGLIAVKVDVRGGWVDIGAKFHIHFA